MCNIQSHKNGGSLSCQKSPPWNASSATQGETSSLHWQAQTEAHVALASREEVSASEKERRNGEAFLKEGLADTTPIWQRGGFLTAAVDTLYEALSKIVTGLSIRPTASNFDFRVCASGK